MFSHCRVNVKRTRQANIVNLQFTELISIKVINIKFVELYWFSWFDNIDSESKVLNADERKIRSQIYQCNIHVHVY